MRRRSNVLVTLAASVIRQINSDHTIRYTFCAPDLREAVYRGKPIDHTFIVAVLWNRTTQLELIQPLVGTNIYTEFLDRHGDGLHHVKEWVDDCQKALKEYRNRGIEVIQSGKFDEDEHYYLDTDLIRLISLAKLLD
jgi:glyoxalase/bleomycin resistance protein/dioxygenase superfamily protein